MMKTEFTLGYSPCPNDCFIFDALVHQKIDTEGFTFKPYISDVEDLNKKAFNGDLDITKLSFNAFGQVLNNYVLLDAGAALGKGCGPLVISKNEIKNPQEALTQLKIGIPGKHTTANLLFSIAFPKAQNKTELIFSNIEEALLSGEIDAGVIIHENRFTYEKKGLKKIIDLGEFWETTTGCAIPLGGIAIQRNIPLAVQQKIESLVRKSVAFAFNNPNESKAYVKAHAQEMEEMVMQQHIQLYVNEYSLSLGKVGREAIENLFKKGAETKFFSTPTTNLFVQ